MNKLFIVLNDNIMQQLSKNNSFEVTELQKNILSSNLIENKIVVLFKDKQSFDDYFSMISKNKINKITVLNIAGEIFLEKQIDTNSDISIISYTKKEENEVNFYLEISIFDQIERG